ncbi:MAG: hypothetical protein JSS02_18875 [Planctomycetes bacterium]|nr:hypothetical protein [Planctomycetota bacterium]
MATKTKKTAKTESKAKTTGTAKAAAAKKPRVNKWKVQPGTTAATEPTEVAVAAKTDEIEQQHAGRATHPAGFVQAVSLGRICGAGWRPDVLGGTFSYFNRAEYLHAYTCTVTCTSRR